MDAKIERRLTKEERKIIRAIEDKASKRAHVPEYNVKWIIEYMIESFKDFDYEEKQDAIDMLDAIYEIAEKCNIMTKKEITEDRKYMMKEYVDSTFEDEDEGYNY